MLAGFPEGNVREIPSDERFRIRVEELARAIAADRSAGFTPFLVVGNAGSVNTGAVDDLAALADIAARERLWFHVDGAYGGFFLLTERGRARMAGVERSDSIVLDPHKSLFLPYGVGSLLVRDGDALKRAHALSAAYLPSMQEDPDLVDFNQISPELSRSWRGLRVWLPIKMHGIGPFRRNLDEKLDLAAWATEELRGIPGVEILAEPQLSIVAFRWKKAGLAGEELNRVNPRSAGSHQREKAHLPDGDDAGMPPPHPSAGREACRLALSRPRPPKLGERRRREQGEETASPSASASFPSARTPSACGKAWRTSARRSRKRAITIADPVLRSPALAGAFFCPLSCILRENRESLRFVTCDQRGNAPGSLRDRRAARRGRDGGGLPGAGHAAGAHGGGQGPAGAPLVVRRVAAALRAGGEDDLAALAPAHLRAVRRGARRTASSTWSWSTWRARRWRTGC